MPATICGSAAGRTSRRIRSSARHPVRARRVDQRRVDPAHAVDRVQQHREEAEEGDERDLLPVADVVQQDDRDRQQRGRRHRAPVLDVRHRQRRASSARARSGCRARRRRRRRSRSRAPIRTRLGTTWVLNCENSHMSWNSIEDRRQPREVLRSAPAPSRAARRRGSRAAPRSRAPTASAVYGRRRHARRPAATGASAATRRSSRRHQRSGWRARGSRSRARARTAGRCSP